MIVDAHTWWKKDVYDPTVHDTTAAAKFSKDAITYFIQKGLGWTWEDAYKGDGDFEWCGAFAAAQWAQVKPQLRKTYFSSTYRLDRYAKYRSAFGEKNTGTGRLVLDLDERTTIADFQKKWTVQQGDILLIGPSGYGAHICLVESFAETTGTFSTIEGNGTGRGPHGERQQGVVKALRKLGGLKGSWCARRIIRPSEEDLL